MAKKQNTSECCDAPIVWFYIMGDYICQLCRVRINTLINEKNETKI